VSALAKTKLEIKRVMAREELVVFLESVLTQVEEGRLSVDKITVGLPEEAEVEFEIEAEHGLTEVELEIKWKFAEETAGGEKAGNEDEQRGEAPTEPAGGEN